MSEDPSKDASLILGNGEQLSLIQVDDVGLPAVAYADAEERGRFTGERLFLQNPKLYGAIVKLLSRGLPYREIADICQVSTQTVTGVAHRECIPIETLRERLGRIGMDVARLSLEAMLDLLHDPVTRAKISAKDLAVIFGIVTDKAQLVLGGATARIESRDITAPDHDDYFRMLADADAKVREMKNVTPTGLSAENPATKGDGPVALENGAAAVDLPAPTTQSTPINPPKGEI